jgi:hypothetical protein
VPYSYPYASYPYVGGYWPGYSDSYQPTYSTYAPAQYAPAAPVTVVYAQPAPEVQRANPVVHEYDQYGQEVEPAPRASASPIYLFAFQDGAIRAASSYKVDGATLHYVTLQHEDRQAPVETLDRSLTLQLNRERRVTVRLP